MQTLAPNLHVIESAQRFLGLEMGARATVLQLDGGLLVHSPVAVDPRSLDHLGPLRWVLAPNKLHHLHVGPWIDAGAEGWAAPGLREKRPDLRFTGVVGEDPHPFGDEVVLLPLQCFPFANEVVLLHRASQTLILTDLMFNIAPTAPWLTRAAMFCACGYPGPSSSLLERVGMKRDLARQELRKILTWDFDRVIMAHGEVIESGGRSALARAYDWLDLADGA